MIPWETSSNKQHGVCSMSSSKVKKLQWNCSSCFWLFSESANPNFQCQLNPSWRPKRRALTMSRSSWNLWIIWGLRGSTGEQEPRPITLQGWSNTNLFVAKTLWNTRCESLWNLTSSGLTWNNNASSFHLFTVYLCYDLSFILRSSKRVFQNQVESNQNMFSFHIYIGSTCVMPQPLYKINQAALASGAGGSLAASVPVRGENKDHRKGV